MEKIREQIKRAAFREQVMAWLQIVLGCMIGAAAYPLFLDPGKIAPGGLTGVAMILKNQWGWAGFTTHKLKPCKVMARLIAIVANWWNIFCRLADVDRHLEPTTSRPQLRSSWILIASGSL